VNAFWAYFWPPFGAGLAVGIIAGAFVFRRRRTRNIALALGIVATLALAALWHGPLGGADKFTAEVESTIRAALVNNEIPEVGAHLHRQPLTRRVLLSGPADDFQRRQLVILMNEIPGVESASWSGGTGVPLIGEGAAVALLGFLLGLLVAYLRELRRRYNAEWNW
jgi:peptidoglycan/LPS O-acetylase OafA/YrhL